MVNNEEKNNGIISKVVPQDVLSSEYAILKYNNEDEVKIAHENGRYSFESA